MPIIELCHVILSSKENTLRQEVSQILVLGWDRTESGQTQIQFQKGSLVLTKVAPGFWCTYQHRSKSYHSFLLALVGQKKHKGLQQICLIALVYSETRGNTYRQSGPWLCRLHNLVCSP